MDTFATLSIIDKASTKSTGSINLASSIALSGICSKSMTLTKYLIWDLTSSCILSGNLFPFLATINNPFKRSSSRNISCVNVNAFSSSPIAIRASISESDNSFFSISLEELCVKAKRKYSLI